MSEQNIKNNDLPLNDAASASSFPIPVTIEEFRKDVMNLFYLQLCTIANMTNEASAWRIIGKEQFKGGGLYPPDVSEQHEFCYEDIRDTVFVEVLEALYQYAYFGVDNGYLANESHVLQTRHIYDMSTSRLLRAWCWDGSGSSSLEDFIQSINNCLRVAELAEARCSLEGQEIWSFFDPNTDFANSVVRLSIRQMALLAGMEEMSIRAAANPKRANPLKTFSDKGRTYILVTDAKTWLQSKNRYVSIKNMHETAIINLVNYKFLNTDHLLSVVVPCLELKDNYKDFLKKYDITSIDKSALANPDLVRELANEIGFPVDLFSLRVREVLVNEELLMIERELRNVVSHSGPNIFADQL